MSTNDNSQNNDTGMNNLRAKILLAEASLQPVEFTAKEAEQMGAFTEDAISEANAQESNKARE